jgi:hypothetical protein
MTATLEETLAQFHRGAMADARRIGLSAYVLKEDGSVLRIWPDGRRDHIVRLGLRRDRTGGRDALRLL